MIFQLGNILLLRLKQLLRILYYLGILRMLLVIGIIGYLIIVTYILISTEKNNYLIASLYLLLNLMIHLTRRDKKFLMINVTWFKMVYLVEYLLLSLPLIIFLLLHGRWLALLYLVAGTLFISVIKPVGIRHKSFNTKNSFNTSVQKFIPSNMYEWKAGVRKNLTVLLIVYGLGIGLSYFVAAIPVAMLIIGLVILDFFIPYESWQMLLSFEKGPEKMLLYKIKRHFLLYAICSLPLVILFVIFHSDLWYIPFIEFIILLFIHIYMITIKFAYFRLDGNTGVNFILQLIGIIFGLIPVTAPFLLLFSVFFFQKACVNLKLLLHDYN